MAYEYVDSTGTILPDTEDLLTTVEGEYRAALGATLNTDPATPQGRLIATEVDARDTFLRNNAAVANQINPNISEGIFLDAIWALTGGQRRSMTATEVKAVAVGGLPTTLIPAGSQAQTPAGDIFQTTGDVTLDALGQGTVDFIALVGGPIPCEAGQLNQIVTAILGWETVLNANDGTPGEDEESDVQSRLRRKNTLALQGVALPEAIISGVNNVQNVQSMSFRENYGDVAIVIDGINIGPHSIYACINGGTDQQAAAAILAKKSLGCGYNGAVTVNVTDAASGQVYPVKFDRPTLVPIKARVTITANNVVADPATVVRQAILDYANGNIEGERGFVVDGDVSPFELAGAINIESPGIYVRLLEVAKVANAYGTATITILLNELATINVNNIEVVIV